jgi:hypothetical protein
VGYWRLPALCTLLARGSQLPTRLDRPRAACAIAPRHHPQLQARRHRPEAYRARWSGLRPRGITPTQYQGWSRRRQGLARGHRGHGVTRRVLFCDREASSPYFRTLPSGSGVFVANRSEGTFLCSRSRAEGDREREDQARRSELPPEPARVHAGRNDGAAFGPTRSTSRAPVQAA